MRERGDVALRAGVRLGVIRDFIPRRFKDFVLVSPEPRAERSYWLVTQSGAK
jgi:hypothetical protein